MQKLIFLRIGLLLNLLEDASLLVPLRHNAQWSEGVTKPPWLDNFPIDSLKK